MPSRPLGFVVINLPVAIFVVTNPFVERAKELLLDFVTDSVKPAHPDIRRGFTGDRHHQRSPAAAARNRDSSPLLNFDIGMFPGKINDLPGIGVFRFIGIEKRVCFDYCFSRIVLSRP